MMRKIGDMDLAFCSMDSSLSHGLLLSLDWKSSPSTRALPRHCQIGRLDVEPAERLQRPHQSLYSAILRSMRRHRPNHVYHQSR